MRICGLGELWILFDTYVRNNCILDKSECLLCFVKKRYVKSSWPISALVITGGYARNRLPTLCRKRNGKRPMWCTIHSIVEVLCCRNPQKSPNTTLQHLTFYLPAGSWEVES